jgi:hypothetical protein
VEGGGLMGWISKKDVILPERGGFSSQGGSGTGTSAEEVELAGRGFSQDVEDKYRGSSDSDQKRAYAEVDQIQATAPNLNEVANFAREGKLGGAR